MLFHQREMGSTALNHAAHYDGSLLKTWYNDMATVKSENALIGDVLLGVLFHISIQTVEFERFMFHYLAQLC